MWRIEGNTGEWNSQRFHARIVLARPDEGLHHIQFGGVRLDGAQLMQVRVPGCAESSPACVDEAYVRGPDVIVTYAETPQRRVRPQVYWRILDEPLVSPGVVIEGIVSVQTQSLDSDPRAQLATTVPGGNWQCSSTQDSTGDFEPIDLQMRASQQLTVQSAGTALLARMPTVSCSYGHVIFGSDTLEAQIAWDPARSVSTLSTTHFGQRLEKGLLRRAWLRAIVVPRERDEELVQHFLEDSMTAAPPLAT